MNWEQPAQGHRLITMITELRNHPLRLLSILVLAFVAFTGAYAYGSIGVPPADNGTDPAVVGVSATPSVWASDQHNTPEPTTTYVRAPQKRVQLDDNATTEPVAAPTTDAPSHAAAPEPTTTEPAPDPTTAAPSAPAPPTSPVARPDCRQSGSEVVLHPGDPGYEECVAPRDGGPGHH